MYFFQKENELKFRQEVTTHFISVVGPDQFTQY
jgi:hypothetical protein